MESQASFVRTQHGVELDSVATIHLHLILIVRPHHSELNDPFGNGDNLERSPVLRILLEEA